MTKASPTTHGLLGMLAIQSWTGYELTRQLQRSLRFVWPSSAGHLYREQKRLVRLGWANVEHETVGSRTRNRYSITPKGEAALRAWLASEPEEPHFEIEGMLRLFHASHGSTGELVKSMHATADAAIAMRDELVAYAAEYLEEGGPLWMLEHDLGGANERIEWHGRMMYPERLHVVALVIDGSTRLLDALASFATNTAAEARGWEAPTDPSITADTRARLEAVRDRYRPPS